MSLAKKLQAFRVDFMKGTRTYVKIKWVRFTYWSKIVSWLCRKFKPAKIWCDEERKTFNIMNGYMNGRDLGNYLAKNNLLSFWDGKNIVIPFGWTLKIGHSYIYFSEGVKHD